MTDWHLDVDPSVLDALPVPRRGAASKDRIEGMPLALAGDALGNTTEGQTPSPVLMTAYSGAPSGCPSKRSVTAATASSWNG